MKRFLCIPGFVCTAVVIVALAQEVAPQEPKAPATPTDVDSQPALVPKPTVEIPAESVNQEPSVPKEQAQPTAPTGPPVTTIKVPPPPLDPNEYRMSSQVELVLLDVSVKNRDGGFVSGLKQSDFKVFEDKVSQNLTVFQAQDVPVTVGLIVDNSGSVRPKKPEVVTAALTFVKFSNPSDEVFVVNFNDTVRMGLPDGVDFTGDARMLRDGLLRNPAQGRTALYDALLKGFDHLKKGRLDKKTLVLISDGGDNMSEATKDDLIRRATESNATVYTVGTYDSDDKDRNPGFLKELARITGGEAFLPEGGRDIVKVCEKIAKDIRNRYTIGYIPSNRNFDGKLRRLRVVAESSDGKPYQIRTRTQYIASAVPTTSERSREGGK